MTHPFHPLRGRTFELVDRRRTWGEDRVYYRDGDDRLRRLPAAWTSVATADPFCVVAAGRALFRADDLVRLAAMIRSLTADEGTDGEATRVSIK